MTAHEATLDPHATGPRYDQKAALDEQPASWWRLLGYGIPFFSALIGLLAACSVLMVGLVWGVHFLFHEGARLINPSYDRVLMDAWGNAVGTVLVIVLVFVMVLATLLTMGERKWSALMQDRMGPNRARINLPGLKNRALWGLPHILADVFKMLTKEELVPEQGNKWIFHLAPALAFGPAFVLFAVIPMAPAFNVGFGDYVYPVRMQVADLNQGLLYIFAIASIAVLGTSLAGWSSNNKYALLGGVRASAQMVSYEVTLGMTLVGLMIVFRTLRLDVMTEQQGLFLWGWVPAWGVVFQPLAIIAYFAAASAEIKRAPFDLPEGESEIVGYFIEYSGLKFGIFMIAEFVEVVVFAGLFSALFFGGWHCPIPWIEDDINNFLRSHLAPGVATAAIGTLYLTYFVCKTVFFCWLSLLVRWTFPRFRYDQVMDLGWKMLLPLSLLNVIITGVAVLVGGPEHAREAAAIVGLVELAGVLFFAIGGMTLTRSGNETLLPDSELATAAAHGDHH